MDSENTTQNPVVMQQSFSHSDTIGKLAEALAKATAKFQPAFKDTSNPVYKSKYAPLENLIEATRAALCEHGLSVLQMPALSGVDIVLTTMLAHSSGEWITSTFQLPGTMRDRFDAQTVGSALTYARRYAYQSILNIAGEVDDDGNAAVGIGSAEAAQAVAKQKVADYKERSAATVTDKNIEMYQETNKDSGKRFWVFKHSDGERWLLDNGLREIGKCHPITKLWFIPDEPPVWETLEKCVAGRFQLKQVAHPEQAAAPKPPADQNHLAGVVMKLEEKPKKKGKGTYTAMTLDDGQTYNIFDTGLSQWLSEGKPFVFLTEKNGQYTNIVDIVSVGGVTLTRIDGKLVEDIQREPYKATDADLPSNMFP